MRLRIDYYDQNAAFEKLLPRSGTVDRTVASTNSLLTWYLVRLDDPVQYEGSLFDRLLIASRWQGRSVGEPEPTSVFILIVPIGTEVGQGFNTSEFAHVLWGIANLLST